MIVFVYDTECLIDEADDPISAVLYFHPSWVSDSQKVALCGQLMGTSYFLKDCFFNPRILALQNGKFVLKEFGRFILVRKKLKFHIIILITKHIMAVFLPGYWHRSEYWGSIVGTSRRFAEFPAQILPP